MIIHCYWYDTNYLSYLNIQIWDDGFDAGAAPVATQNDHTAAIGRRVGEAHDAVAEVDEVYKTFFKSYWRFSQLTCVCPLQIYSV